MDSFLVGFQPLFKSTHVSLCGSSRKSDKPVARWRRRRPGVGRTRRDVDPLLHTSPSTSGPCPEGRLVLRCGSARVVFIPPRQVASWACRCPTFNWSFWPSVALLGHHGKGPLRASSALGVPSESDKTVEQKKKKKERTDKNLGFGMRSGAGKTQRVNIAANLGEK